MGILASKVAKQVIWQAVNLTVIFLPVLLLAVFFATSSAGGESLQQGLILVFLVFMGIDWIWFSQIRWRVKEKLGFGTKAKDKERR